MRTLSSNTASRTDPAPEQLSPNMLVRPRLIQSSHLLLGHAVFLSLHLATHSSHYTMDMPHASAALLLSTLLFRDVTRCE